MFGPVDKAQEANIKDIKVTYRSEGPNIDWAYLKKLHPAIHVIRALTEHIEEEFQTLTQGKKHTTPKKELDIQKLQQSYQTSGYHKNEKGREITNKMDCAQDYATDGCIKLQRGKLLHKWRELQTFKRATTEDWNQFLDDDKDNGQNEEDEPMADATSYVSQNDEPAPMSG